MFDKAYWSRLYEANNQAPGDIRAWLASIDLSNFDPIEGPPMTSAKLSMIEATRGDDVENLEAIIMEGGLGISKDVISSSHINAALRVAGFPTMQTSRISKALKGLGFVQVPHPIKFAGKACRFYVRGAWAQKMVELEGQATNYFNDQLREQVNDL